MTIYSDISKVRYEGNGTTKSFAVPFYFLSNADGTAQIAVFVGDSDTSLTEGSDYTVSGIGDTNGGTVIFTQAPASGTQIAITRNVPHVQSVKFIDGEDFPANEFERALDKKTMEIQELQENLARAIVLPPTSNESPLTVRAELLAARIEAVKAANTAVQAANEASNSETSAANSASEAIAAQSAIFDNSGFQAVAADLTGPNNIGYVAENYKNIMSSADKATTAATSAAASAQVAQEVAQAAQENIVAKTEEFNANAEEKQNLINAAAAAAESSANTAEQAAENAVAAIPPQVGNAGKFLKTDGTAASWDNIAGGIEIGDIGFSPFGVDETKNTRRYLNGQVISQTQFSAFTTKLKSWQSTRANLFTTEDNWQAEKTASKLGQCGKFVIDDSAGTIRLPCVVNINGLTDLANCGVVKSESLPNITGTAGQFRMNTRYSTGVFSHTESTAGQTAGGTAVNGYEMSFDASRSSSAYQDNAPVQQEAVQYPYFIQVATSSEDEVDITNEIQLNNPFTLFESKYSADTIVNASWLISNGTYHSGATYVTAYQALVVENNAEVAVGATVTLPNGSSYTKRGLSVKLSTDTYDDYDYVLNTTDSTFRLPVSSHDNGRVLVESYVNGAEWYNIYSDGWCEQGGYIPNQTRNDDYPITLMKSYKDVNYSLITDKHIVTSVTSGMGAQSFYTKNKTASGFTTGVDSNVECYWRTSGYADITSTNIKLYFYIGEIVQDANIINASGVLTRVANCLDRTVASDVATVTGWSMPDYSRMVNMGTTVGSNTNPGTAIYTAPSDGWFITQATGNYTNNYIGVLITLPTGQQFSRTNGGSTSNENSGFEFLVPAGTTIVGNRNISQTVYFAPLKGVN